MDFYNTHKVIFTITCRNTLHYLQCRFLFSYTRTSPGRYHTCPVLTHDKAVRSTHWQTHLLSQTKPRKHLPLRSYFAECLKVVVFAMKTVFFASFRMRSMRNAQPPVKRDTSSPALPVLQLLCRPHNTLVSQLVLWITRGVYSMSLILFIDLYMHFKSCHYCHKLIHNLYRTSGNYSWMNNFNFFNLLSYVHFENCINQISENYHINMDVFMLCTYNYLSLTYLLYVHL